MHVKAALLNISWVRAVGSAKQCAGRVAHAELLSVIMTVCLANDRPGLANIPKWERWVLGAVEPYIILQIMMCQPISRVIRSLDQMCPNKDVAGMMKDNQLT